MSRPSGLPPASLIGGSATRPWRHIPGDHRRRSARECYDVFWDDDHHVQSSEALSSPEIAIEVRVMTSPETALPSEPSTREEIAHLMELPNGSHLLLEHCLEGRISPDAAARVIDRFPIAPAKATKRFFVSVV
jgi:hypothetical protein